MMTCRKGVAIVGLLVTPMLLTATGCQTAGKRTAIGAGTGAAVGAIAGGIIGHQGGNKWEGAAIGAATGAAIGGGIGYALDRRAKQRFESIEGVEVQVDPDDYVTDQQTGQQVPERLTLRLSNDVLFAKNEASLSPQGMQKIAEIAAIMRDYPDTSALVKGYASSEGADAYNQDLSERRAHNVANALVANKIHPSRVMAMGFGESNPIASNATEEGRMLNRRVEIEIFPSDEVR